MACSTHANAHQFDKRRRRPYARDEVSVNRMLGAGAIAGLILAGCDTGVPTDLESPMEVGPTPPPVQSGPFLPAVVEFDFSVNEQCHEFSDCQLLEPFIRSGKPVFNAEYLPLYVNDAAERQGLARTAEVAASAPWCCRSSSMTRSASVAIKK